MHYALSAGMQFATVQEHIAGSRMGMLGWGGFPHEFNLRRGQRVGLIDEVAEGTLQVQGFGGEGAGGFGGAGVFVPQRVKADGGSVSIMRTDTNGA